jgi:transposase
MARGDRSERGWRRLAPLLPRREGRGRPWRNHRRVIDGIRWVLRTGAPWRDLPTRYGPWSTCDDRFVRWQRDGTWDRWLQALQGEADEAGRLDWEVSVDATVVRAHQHAAGGSRREKGGPPSRPTTPWGAAAAAGRPSGA